MVPDSIFRHKQGDEEKDIEENLPRDRNKTEKE